MKMQRIKRPMYKHMKKVIEDGTAIRDLEALFREILKADNNAYISIDTEYRDFGNGLSAVAAVRWAREYTEEEYVALKEEIKKEKERLKQLEEAALVSERETYLKLKAKFEG